MISLNCNSQDVKLVNKGYVVQNDSTVLLKVGTYRRVREKISLADSLINSYQEQIRLLTESNKFLNQKNENLSEVNTLLSGQVKDLNKANIDLLSKYEESVKKKWYQRPEIYGVAGLIVGILIAK